MGIYEHVEQEKSHTKGTNVTHGCVVYFNLSKYQVVCFRNVLCSLELFSIKCYISSYSFTCYRIECYV